MNRLTWVCLGAGVALRLVLASVNRDANDDHIEVVRRLLASQDQPTVLTCWECFQPKLFHLLCAWIARTIHLTTRGEITVAAQFVNVLLGIGTLLIGRMFIYRVSSNPLVRFLATSWLALNPALLAINVQATNDTLVIFTGTVILAGLHGWIASGGRNLAALVVVVLSAGMAPHIKGNGIVLAVVAMVLVVSITAVTARTRRFARAGAVLVLLIFVVLAGATIDHSYQDNYRATGLLAATNMSPTPPPLLFEHTFAHRPGVTSIASAFFTFRIFDLIRTPAMEAAPYALHRTSLWSQLYGRTYSLRFDQWPPSWQGLTADVLWVSRALLLVGLLPTFILLSGVMNAVRQLRHLDLESFAHLLFVAAMLSFMVAYSYRYRDVSVMKAIFVFPALAAFLYFYAKGLLRWLEHSRLRSTIVLAHAAMVGLWVIEETLLLAQLMTR